MRTQKIFQLKKDITSPQFVRDIKAGRIFTELYIKNEWPYLLGSKTFKDWFDDVSDQYEIRNCKIFPKKCEL